MNSSSEPNNLNFQVNSEQKIDQISSLSSPNPKQTHPTIKKSVYYQKLTHRRPWTKPEDSLILSYVQKNGKGKWSQISSQLMNRSGKQIRERYLQILDPKIEKRKFTAEDDERIIEMVQKYGSKWKLISSFLPARSDNQIKNRFYTHIKKKILLVNKEKYRDVLEKIQLEQYSEEKKSIQQEEEQKHSVPQSAFTKVEPKTQEEEKNQQIKIKVEHQEQQQEPNEATPRFYSFRPPVLLIQRNNNEYQQNNSIQSIASQQQQQQQLQSIASQQQQQQQQLQQQCSTPTTVTLNQQQQYAPQLMKAISTVSQLQAQLVYSNNQFVNYFNWCQKIFPSYDFKELIKNNQYAGYQQAMVQNQIGMSPRLPVNFGMPSLIQSMNLHQDNSNNLFKTSQQQQLPPEQEK